MNSVKEFLNIGEFAELIGVSESTLRNWDRQGRLKPHHRTKGNQRVYARSQAEEFTDPPRIQVIQGRKKRDVYYFNYADNSVTDKIGNRIILQETPEGVRPITTADMMDLLFHNIYRGVTRVDNAFSVDRELGDDVKWVRMT